MRSELQKLTNLDGITSAGMAALWQTTSSSSVLTRRRRSRSGPLSSDHTTLSRPSPPRRARSAETLPCTSNTRRALSSSVSARFRRWRNLAFSLSSRWGLGCPRRLPNALALSRPPPPRLRAPCLTNPVRPIVIRPNRDHKTPRGPRRAEEGFLHAYDTLVTATMQRFEAVVATATGLLRRHPRLYLAAKSMYLRRPIFKGIRLVCYAVERVALERYSGLGPGRGEVLVEVVQTAMNVGTERSMFLGRTPAELPFTPTASGVGRVMRIGSGVKHVRRGDLVAGPMSHSTVHLMPASRCVPVDTGLSTDDAAFLHLALISQQSIRVGNVASVGRIVVFGQGVIGRLATLLARAMDIEVVCVTRTRAKLELLGEEEGWALEDSSSLSRICMLQAEVVVDATGDHEAVHLCAQAAAPGGTIVLLGSNRQRTMHLDPNGVFAEKRLTLAGAHINNQPGLPPGEGGDYRSEGREILELIKQRRLQPGLAVSHKVAGRDLPAYYSRRLGTDEGACGVLVDWQQMDPEAAENHFREAGVPRVARELPKLGIALIGCGNIGRTNAQAIARSKGFHLRALVDSRLWFAEALSADFNAPAFADFGEALADPGVDVVFLSVPHFLHHAMACAAADAGKHVLVEKPLATRLQDGIEMVDAARRNKVVLRTFYPFACERVHRLAKGLVAADILGRLRGFSIESFQYRPNRYWFVGSPGKAVPNWRADKERSGGGVLIMNMVHMMDNLRYVSGIDIGNVFARASTQESVGNVENSISMVMGGRGGEIGSVYATTQAPGGSESSLRIWGDAGQIRIVGGQLRFYSHRSVGSHQGRQWHSIAVRETGDARVHFLEQFRLAISRSEMTGPREPGLLGLAIVDAAYQSASTGRPVEVVDLTEDDLAPWDHT